MKNITLLYYIDEHLDTTVMATNQKIKRCQNPSKYRSTKPMKISCGSAYTSKASNEAGTEAPASTRDLETSKRHSEWKAICWRSESPASARLSATCSKLLCISKH
jgi:hypothetical protein